MARKTILTADPPNLTEHHVRVPDQLAEILGASKAHERGATGKGIRIAVIDSGFYPHPFYLSRDYNIRRIATPREPNPEIDEYGHGTALLASLLSIAPEAEVLAIKCMDRDPCEAIRMAISLKPHILSCSWGFNIDNPRTKKLPAEYLKLRDLIRFAVDAGICVTAAAGNGQYSFPGSMPEVISVGGVYYGPNGTFSPSDLSSRYQSSIFKSRQVPDVCGLIGNRPHGRLLLVPVPPQARLAKRPAFSMIAAGDSQALTGAKRTPGWAMFSGTSAATAMVAGAAALVLQKRPGLLPSEVKEILTTASRRVEPTGCRVLSLDLAF